MSRFSSPALLASSSSTGTVTAVTSPVLSIASSIRVHSLGPLFAKLRQRNTVPAALVVVVPDLVHAPENDVGSESRFPRGIRHRRLHLRRIEPGPLVPERDRNGIGERLGFHVDPLVGAPMVGMPRDVATGLVDR